MPDTPETGQDRNVTNTKVRHVRVGQLWDDASETAAGQHETVADVIRRALAAYVADPDATNIALATIRGSSRGDSTG